MSFFVTSRGMGKGGDLRGDAGDGLIGADRFCVELATAVHPTIGAKNWHAYLSTAQVAARARIGNGPFINANGVTIAATSAQLHDEGMANDLSGTTNLDEKGALVPSGGAAGNVHDILTGATADGGIFADAHCNNWTSSFTGYVGRVGHSNRMGTGGMPPTSWNSAHNTSGCSAAGSGSVASGGGRGSFYCAVAP